MFCELSNRRSQSIFDGPTKNVDAIQDCALWQSRFISPFLRSQTLSVVFKIAVISSIQTLLFSSCPDAILGFIAFIAIAAFYAHSIGSVSHIREKILKALPTLAVRNAATAIIFKTLIFATLLHGIPNKIRAGLALFVSGIRSRKFFQPTSATFSIWQSCTTYDFFITAITVAEPGNRFVTAGVTIDTNALFNCKFDESLTNKI